MTNKTVRFILPLRGKEYSGFCSEKNIDEHSKHFFVHIGTESRSIIVAELNYTKNMWKFDQGERFIKIGELNSEEGSYVAEYLGNVVVNWFK